MIRSRRCRYCNASVSDAAVAAHEKQCPRRPSEAPLELFETEDDGDDRELDDAFDVAGTIVDFSDDD